MNQITIIQNKQMICFHQSLISWLKDAADSIKGKILEETFQFLSVSSILVSKLLSRCAIDNDFNILSMYVYFTFS